MAKLRKHAKPVLERHSGSNGRRGEALQESDTLSIWTDGLELLDSALIVLADSDLLPGRDDSLIARGNALGTGLSYSRLALDGLRLELFPPAIRLVRDQFTIWRQVAAVRLSLAEPHTAERPRRRKKQLKKALKQLGSGPDADLAGLARSGSVALRAMSDRGFDAKSGPGCLASADTCALIARWGLIALGLLIHEARELGLMAGEWGTRVVAWETALSSWLESPPQSD